MVEVLLGREDVNTERQNYYYRTLLLYAICESLLNDMGGSYYWVVPVLVTCELLVHILYVA